ncbi:hypothetical protein PAXINDRAFT_75832, partial [Paxillus involutus ATCC 200175]
FPLLYDIALDVLPARASALPCKRVFSSGKEIDIDWRSNLSPETTERLHILKNLFRHDPLPVVDSLVDNEDELHS